MAVDKPTAWWHGGGRWYPTVTQRFWWLIIGPIAFGLSWFPLLMLGPKQPGTPQAIWWGISGLAPLTGFLLVVIYALQTREWRRLRPYLAFAVAALVFAGSMIEMAITMPKDSSADAIIPLLPFGSGLIEATLALAGGLISVPRLRDPWR